MDGEVRPRVRRPCRGPPSCFPCPRSRRRACKEEEASEGGWGGGRGGWASGRAGGVMGVGGCRAGGCRAPQQSAALRRGMELPAVRCGPPRDPERGEEGQKGRGGQQGRGEPMRDPQGAAGGEGGDGGRGKTAQHPQSTAPELRLKASPPLPEVGGGCEPPLC